MNIFISTSSPDQTIFSQTLSKKPKLTVPTCPTCNNPKTRKLHLLEACKKRVRSRWRSFYAALRHVNEYLSCQQRLGSLRVGDIVWGAQERLGVSHSVLKYITPFLGCFIFIIDLCTLRHEAQSKVWRRGWTAIDIY